MSMYVYVYYILFFYIYMGVIWCLFYPDPLYVCNSAVCDMDLQ